jgi:hypothetical protein
MNVSIPIRGRSWGAASRCSSWLLDVVEDRSLVERPSGSRTVISQEAVERSVADINGLAALGTDRLKASIIFDRLKRPQHMALQGRFDLGF